MRAPQSNDPQTKTASGQYEVGGFISEIQILKIKIPTAKPTDPAKPVPAPARAMPGQLGNCPPQIFRVGTFPTGVFQPGSKTHLAFPAGEASGGEIPGPLLGPGVLVGGFTNAFSPRNPSIFDFY